MSDSNNSGQSSFWTREEKKKFEGALEFCESDLHLWENIASILSRMSENFDNDFTSDLMAIDAVVHSPKPADNHESIAIHSSKGKGELVIKSSNKRWTKEEHGWFLDGLKVHGKGAWRLISQEFVQSRTPAQVASHAQKYYLHQEKEKNKKKRSSIFDITTAG